MSLCVVKFQTYCTDCLCIILFCHPIFKIQTFFHDLANHQTLLDTLSSKTDLATKNRLQSSHSRLANLAKVEQDKALDFEHSLNQRISKWVTFEPSFKQLLSWLTTLEKDIPTAVNEKDTTETIKHKVEKLTDLQKQLESKNGQIYRVLDQGREILKSGSCPSLEQELEEFSRKSGSINDQLNKEIERFA